jgi:hypothetical protein
MGREEARDARHRCAVVDMLAFTDERLAKAPERRESSDKQVQAR